MPKIAWNVLLRIGLVELRLDPKVFWNLTPGEFMMFAGLDMQMRGMSRQSFADLAARYPDKPKENQ